MVILEGKELRKSFGGLIVLDGLNFSLHQGEILGLIGPNGSGKTTLFNVVSGFYRPDSGRIYYQGRDITGWRPDRICRSGMTRTFQLTHPFESMSVYENVRVGAVFGGGKEAGRRDAASVQRKVGRILGDFGLEEKRDFPVRSLTSGELRRLELARAIATDPEVLLVDEVMAGLTQAETRDIMNIIAGMRDRHGVSVLIIEHIMKAVMGLSDRVMVLDFGRKIAEGTPDEVVDEPRVVEVYLGREDDGGVIGS